MPRATPLLLTACLLSVPPLPASAAMLRPLTTLDTDVVHLSDLFDGAGADAARALGPAPAPGGRIVIEAPQLAAIARQFAVDWRPASASDRVVLDRPGRLLPREDVLTALRQALTGIGAPEGDIETPGFTAPLVAVAGHPQTMFEQLDYDAASGRFTGVLAVTGEGMAMQRMRLSGTLREIVELPVLVRRLIPGSVIQSGDVQMARIHAGLARGDVAREPAQAVGLAVRHMTLAGQPLLLADLARPPAIEKGARVTMQLQAPGITLVAQGQAMESGGIGDRIRVLNPNSRAVVDADVVGPNQVRVATGSVAQADARAERLGANFAATGDAGRIVP